MKFISFRRYWLDKFLSESDFNGKVLDVGGIKKGKRGEFRPPMSNVDSWEYLNISDDTLPDYLCSSEAIPTHDNTFDVVLIAEIIEHLECPEKTLKESLRVLKAGGKLIATIPFLYPVHADPFDFQRWTPEKITMEFDKVGFDEVKIEYMGGFFSVLYDIWYVFLNDGNCRWVFFRKILRKCILPLFIILHLILDKFFAPINKKITTGFYATAIKKL